MSLYTNAMASAADTTQVQAGEKSFLEDAGDALTYGAGAAVVSGLGSIYNTAAAGANLLGADVEELNTAKYLESMDSEWAKYYGENKDAIDTVGFIGTSFIPGMAAIKGLNMARAGSGAGAFGRALGFARTQQALSLDRALVELAAEGGTVFSRINKNKAAAMAWGFADQTLTAAAFETGVALTMKQSPMLADDSWWDIGKTAMMGAAFGGVIGGSIDSLLLSKSFKQATKAIDGKQRSYDYISDISKTNLDAGDKAYAIADSLVALPRDVLDADKILELSFHLSSGKTTRSVDISKILGTSLKNTERTGKLDFELALQQLSTDSTVTQPFAEMTLSKLKKLQDSGASDTQVRDAIGDTILNLKAVRAATELPVTSHQDLWYFKKALSSKELEGIKTLEDWEKAIKSSTPFGDNAYSKPYLFLGTPEQKMASFSAAARIGGTGDNSFPTLSAAWKAGKDVAFLSDGTLRVNDASTLWRRTADDVYSPSQYMNTRTGAMTHDTVLTAADRLPAGKSLDNASIKSDAVYLQHKDGTKVLSMKVFNPAGDTEYFTARHAWASKLQDKNLPTSIDVTDFSLMDRLRNTVDDTVLEGITITSNGQPLGTANLVGISDTIKSAKLSEAQRLFMDAADAGVTLDVRAVAYQLNVDAQWLEATVAARFRDSIAGRAVSLSNAPEAGKISLPLDSYTRRENLLADYARPQQFQELGAITPGMTPQQKRLLIQEQVANTGGQFVTGDLAWAQRVRDAVQVTKNASAAVLGSEKVALLPDLSQTAAKLSDSLGAGASTLGAANANYGDTLAVAMQTSGKHVHQWIQDASNMVVDALSTPAALLRADPNAAAELGVLTNLLRSTDEKYVWNALNPKQLILRELQGATLTPEKAAELLASAKAAGRRTTINVDNQVTIDFLNAHTVLNSTRVDKRSVLNAARGFTSSIESGTVYVPPVDTTYFQHFAFVRPIEGKAFSTSEVSMIFGRNAEELSKRLASVNRDNFDVIPKGATEKYFKAKEAYDFDLTINEPRINSELRKTGALNNMQPEVRAENLVEDYMRWHQNQESRLVRDAVETNYAQQFAELRKLGETYSDLATSKFAGTLRKSKTEFANPYDDYIKTGLDVSKRSEYTFLHQANEFVDALGTRAYQGVSSIFGDAQKGMVTWQEANAQMEKLGIKGVYNSKEDFFTANVPRDRNIVREYVSKANSFLANTVLRLDFFNSIVNTVSTPMMLGTELASLRTLAKTDPALLGKLSELYSVAVPGSATGQVVPSTTKLIANAVKNFFGPDKQQLLARYKANGDVKDTLSQFHSMLDSLALRPDFQVFSKGVNTFFETGAKITLNEQAEQMTRFISADVMRQLSDPLVAAGKLSLKEQNAYMSVFTNRVQGNYISSQRPIVFQGVLGSAVSLFQTYSFNLMQQLLRHVENGDKRAVATLFGLQAGTFGLNGLPLFEAVNTHLIGNSSINQGHHDAYSAVPSILGKQLGDWMMYGTASAFPAFSSSWPALYTRGDINPRHMTILPVSPMDIPAVDASIRLVSNITDMGKKLVGGADITETLLQGLEHNGINRPLAGFAQVLNGKTTTSKGSLISASNDFSLLTTGSRILGAKPMDEAVALNNLFREQAYRAADTERQNHLGEKVKSYLYKNQFPPDDVMDGFMSDYARAGGRVENFNSAMQRWSKDANVSTVEKMRTKLGSSYGQRLNEIMGGTPLEDYRNGAPAVVATDESLPDSQVP